MKRIPVLLFLVMAFSVLSAQPAGKPRKYPSLLWEITGRGMSRPSYLIGTMHVSSKLAFNLPDSFYLALKSARVVALETNPDTWQEDMDRYELGKGNASDYSLTDNTELSMPAEYFGINTLKFYKYDRKIERALSSSSSAINNLLYRSYGNETSDFEEDTYLDMYIYQCGKKWGKIIAGVEDYGKSMELMAEAYRDAARDRNKKDRSYSDWDEAYSADKLQEAYRRGNLDLLDTINKYNSISPAFDEKFLYRRNEIQASSMDSIMRKGQTLFAGVGAAHLPGDRGVIELLRKMGYKLRPVMMGERAGRSKDLLDKIRVPVVFRTDTAADRLFSVDIPGKFYEFGEDPSLDQLQCADMANGSYYLVTRMMTNAWMWNHNEDDVLRVVDSLLYENVPGKILSRIPITRNGYRGFDLVNRTRRGDIQRYQIFITPFEIIFFKMSGNGDYVRNGPEADKFFGSIRFNAYRNSNGGGAGMKSFSPSFGGFNVLFPHTPYTGNDGSWIFDAADPVKGINYRVIRSDIHNYHFAGEDSFDLALMEESFMASDFIDTLLSRRYFKYQGFPALEDRILDKTGALYLARFIIQGPHYYTLVAKAGQESPELLQFMDSFSLTPFRYGNPATYRDTSFCYSVTTPFYPEEKKTNLNIPRYNWQVSVPDDDDEPKDMMETGGFRSRIIFNDSTGEKIFISFSRFSPYRYIQDSAELARVIRRRFFMDTAQVLRLNRKEILPDGTHTWETISSEPGSSRTLWTRTFYRQGFTYVLATQTDTVTAASPFLSSFFNHFTPAEKLPGVDPLTKKSTVFFSDFNSPDTLLYKKSLRYINNLYVDSADLPLLQHAIGNFSWERKNYLDVKKLLIDKLGDIHTAASADYLGSLYDALDDTVQLQYTVLENLLLNRTPRAYHIFRDIMVREAPVLDFTGAGFTTQALHLYSENNQDENNPRDGKFLDELQDSLRLTRMILPDLLPLLGLDDYKLSMMKLLGDLIDSNLVRPADYESYFQKFLIEAREKLKKQVVAEKRKAISLAEDKKANPSKSTPGPEDDTDYGNSGLGLYTVLLLPFSEHQPGVKPVIEQILRSRDKRLRYNTFIQLLKNGHTFPDSLPGYFASMDEFRYELYSDLKTYHRIGLFPESYNTHLALGRSALLDRVSYGKPDTVEFLERLPVTHHGQKGFIYFFRYKKKKDDFTWKLATVGLVPEDPSLFEFENPGKTDPALIDDPFADNLPRHALDFTSLSETKLNPGKAIHEQLTLELRRMLYARHKSGKEFYKEEDAGTNGQDDQ
ncbi:MAG: TraB/GumN family protein [Chitinophagaceae bacterium]